VVDAFSQIPDGSGSARDYGRGIGGRMMAGRHFGNALCPFFATKELDLEVLLEYIFVTKMLYPPL